jgi:hypothetical protein
MEPTGCPKIFGTNYQTMQQNIPAQRRNKPEVVSLEERINIKKVPLMHIDRFISVIKQTDTYITSNAAGVIYYTI